MPETVRCSACGAELAAGASPEGLCPQCLLKAALPSNPNEAVTVTLPPETRPTPAQPAANLTPGQRFGSYRIGRLLGRGGMGVVYEAEEIDSGRRVALKVLARGLDDPVDRARFLREGRLAAAISHPHTVYIFGTDEIDGIPVIAMELSSAGTLKDRVKAKGPLPPGEAVDVVLQLVSGLEAAAGAGVLHRDIKPSNCFVDADGTVKIGDFGLSISTLARDETHAHLTTTGSFLGTPAFASPEQLKGEELDVRSDIYSVGATLYYLLTGHAPFDDPNLVKLVTMVSQDPAPSPRLLRPEVPKGLAALVARCLAKQPGDRLASYATVIRELEPYQPTAPTPGMLGLRFVAGLVDQIVTGTATSVIAFTLLFTADSANLGPSASMWLGAVNTLLLVAYYASCESLWGATLGKGLCGLRVIGADRRPPGFARALMRAFVFTATLQVPGMLFGVAPSMEDLMGLERAREPGLSPLIAPAALVTQLLLMGLLFSPARRKNGFAAVHERVTATRVVTRSYTQLRPALVSATPVASSLPPMGIRIGPYHQLGDTGTGELVVGYDQRLKRKVWIRHAAIGSPPVPPLRRDLARPARLHWLGGRRSSTECWDAYEAPEGQPLLRLLDRPTSWDSVRHWLRDLAAELHGGRDDHSLPGLALDRVWITPDGRARLLDWPAPGLDAAERSPDPPFSPHDLASAQQFLHDVGRSALEGAARDLDTPGGALAPSLPLPARWLLQRLADHTFETSERVLEQITAALSRPPTLSRRRRGAHLALCGAPLAFSFAVAFLWVSLLPLMAELVGDPDTLRAALERLEQLEQIDLELLAERGIIVSYAEERQAFEVYIAGRYPNALTELSSSPFMVGLSSHRARLERVLERHPDPSSEEVEAAARIVDSGLGVRFLQAAATGFSGVATATGIGVVMGTGIFFGVAVLSLLLAVAGRGGLILRLLGVAVVTRDGDEVSRWRAFYRALLAWALPILAFAVLVTAGPGRVMGPAWNYPLAVIALVLGMFIGGGLWALLHPERGLQDRIVGTWLVPR